MSSSGSQRIFVTHHWRNALLLAAAFLPALFTALLIDRFAVNIPVWDDWERVRLIEKFEEGEMTAADLYASHIEHRMVIPRIVMLALNKMSGGDLRVEMAFIFGTVAATAIAVFLLLRSTFPDRPELLYPAVLCANLLLFSPMQWENFLWAIQVAFMLPMCCVCWALVVLQARRQWPPWFRFAVCLVLALIGTHSFSHGMLVWPVVFMMALLQRDFAATARSKAAFLGAWAAAAAIVLGCYFSDFENASQSAHAYNQKPGAAPPGVANFGATIADPARVATFFGTFLGNPLARITRFPARDVAPWIGWGFFACFGLAATLWLSRWKKTDDRDRALPWLALGGVALTVALMVALGRAEIAGIRSSITPRYVSMSFYLMLSVMVLGMLFATRREKPSPAIGAGLSFVAGVFLLIQFLTWSYGISRMTEWESSRLHSRTSLMFINHLLPDQDNRLDADPAAVRDLANILDRYGYLSPPLAKEATMAAFRVSSKPLSPRRWKVDRALVSDDGKFLEIDGWTALPMSAGGGAAHGILVTRGYSAENEASPGRIVHIASIHAFPRVSTEIQDNAFNFTRELDRSDFCSWSARVPLSDLLGEDGSPATLHLFAVDARKMRAHALGVQIMVAPDGSVRVEHSPDRRPARPAA